MALALQPGVMETGGAFGRLPNHLVLSPRNSPEVTFLLAYRCLHVDGRSAWGCNPQMMAKTVRAGFSRGIFKRAVKDAKTGGHLERRQGRKKKPGRDTRGRGLAVDRLTFDVPEADYVMVERGLFNGSHTPKEISSFLFLRARGSKLAKPWQLEKRLNATRPTVNRILRHLAEIGLVKNYGTPQAPRWGVASLKNPTFKKADFKKTTCKKTIHSRSTSPSRGISPARSIEQTHAATAPALETPGGIDCSRATSPAVLASRASGERLPSMAHLQATVEAMGVEYGPLLEKFHYYADKNASEGTPISNPRGYFLEMAGDAAGKIFGMQVDLHAINSPNTWARGKALAEVLGTPPELPPKRERERINSRLRAEGLDPDDVLTDWQKARRERSTRANYSTFADAKRMARRKVTIGKTPTASPAAPSNVATRPDSAAPRSCSHLEASTTVRTQYQDRENDFLITPDKKLVIERNASTGAP